MKTSDFGLMVCVSALLFCGFARGAESDFAEADIDEVFYSCLTAKKRFMEQTGVKEFLTPDGTRIIVCVVSTHSKGCSAAAKAAMYKVCRIKAQTELLKADGYELSALTKVENRMVCVDNGQRKTIRSVSTFLDIAEEKVRGIVRSWPVIGTWYSKDGSEFYLAIGTVISAKRAL